ncbi:MAG: hypothetical protein HEQ38_04340 [Gemmatimonas sp.]|nr:hypothetical protein [Gemmatimonas sp.]
MDGRSDLYALGLVAWFALTAQTAFTGENTQRILVRQLTEAVPPLESMRPDLPDSLCAVVNRCCEKNAADRYPTAEALIEALDATQLATPDIPVAIRLLVPDLTAIIPRVSVALVLLGYGNYRLLGYGNASIFLSD